MNFPVYEHLGMTEVEMAQICDALFADDGPLLKHQSRIETLQFNIEDYAKREEGFVGQVRDFEAREDELRAELKKIATMKAEMHGLVAGMKYHQKLAKHRIRETETQIDKRKKQLYLHEARRRLSMIGKELKLNRGPHRPDPVILTIPRHETNPTPEQPILRQDTNPDGQPGNQPSHL